jgi:transcriptional regulator with XRE-family HTH domain
MRGQHQEGVGARIAALREQHRWSQRELAKAVGLDQSAVSRIEAGRRRVSAAELHRITQVFHVSADALLGEAAAEQASQPAWATPSSSGLVRAFSQTEGRSDGEQELLSAIARAMSEPAEAPAPQASTAPAPAVLMPSSPAPAIGPPPGAGAPPGLRRARARSDTYAAPPRDEQYLSPTADALPRAAPSAPARLPSGSHGFAPPLPLSPDMAASVSAPSVPSQEAVWAAGVAGVVRDWFALRDMAAASGQTAQWSTGLTAEGKPAHAPRPWQPVIPPPGGGDVLYDRVARFWRSELHVEPDDGPVPDLVPLVEDGLGVQVIVARVSGPEPAPAARVGIDSDPHPVAATVVEDGVPFVLVNAGRPVVLQRFALVHAFAHLVLGHGDVVDENIGWSRANPREAAANDFAEEFLAPVRAVERWYGRRQDLPRSPTLDTLLELANAFGISAWAALFRSRAAGRLHAKQFAALRSEMKHQAWELLPRQAFLGGLKDTLAHLTPQEVLPLGAFGPPAVLRVPAPMRLWCLTALRDAQISLEDAAAMLRVPPSRLAVQLEGLGLE